jgi:hypothetical protein
MTLNVHDAAGRTVFSHDLVRSVVGWVRGSLYVTTTNPDRLLKVSADGKTATFVDIPYAGDTWYYASTDALWGIAPADGAANKGLLSVVRLDLRSNTVTPWYTLQPDMTGLTRAAIIGLDSNDQPILADLSATTRSGVYIVSAPGQLTPIYVAGRFADASLRRPSDVVIDANGSWVTTVDGKLFRVGPDGLLQRITPATGIRIYDFGGPCG